MIRRGALAVDDDCDVWFRVWLPYNCGPLPNWVKAATRNSGLLQVRHPFEFPSSHLFAQVALHCFDRRDLELRYNSAGIGDLISPVQNLPRTMSLPAQATYAPSPSPPPSNRSVDIELGGQEVITIDLDNLDPNPEDVLDLLKEGQCKVWVWTKLAGEYWRRGFLGAAEKIALAAVECEG